MPPHRRYRPHDRARSSAIIENIRRGAVFDVLPAHHDRARTRSPDMRQMSLAAAARPVHGRRAPASLASGLPGYRSPVAIAYQEIRLAERGAVHEIECELPRAGHGISAIGRGFRGITSIERARDIAQGQI